MGESKNPYNEGIEPIYYQIWDLAYQEGKRDMGNLCLIYLGEFFKASNDAIVAYLKSQGIPE